MCVHIGRVYHSDYIEPQPRGQAANPQEILINPPRGSKIACFVLFVSFAVFVLFVCLFVSVSGCLYVFRFVNWMSFMSS